MNLYATAFAAITLLTLGISFSEGDVKAEKLTEMYSNPLAHGLGDDIEWVKWEDAIEKALEENKPIFLLIHKTWCHACKALKKTMQQSNARKAFKKLSEYFVMVNTEDDEEPFEEEYRPDGKYIPRLLFLDKNGDLISEIKNKKAEYKNYAYYYSSPADILNSMKDVLRYFEIDVPDLKKGDGLKPKKPEKKRSKEDGPEPPKMKKEEEKKDSKKSDETKTSNKKTDESKKDSKKSEL
uniref:Thioredoxin domain-containing protein n=1 Tax=Panagrolaimus superbus TaxID=310955 RepID=A0A914YYS5_9BILA